MATVSELKRMAQGYGIDLKIERMARVVPRQARVTLRSDPLPPLSWEGPAAEASIQAERLIRQMLTVEVPPRAAGKEGGA